MRRRRLTAPEDENPCGVPWCLCWTILLGNRDVASTWALSRPVLWDTWAIILWDCFRGGQTLQGRKDVRKQIPSTFLSLLGEPNTVCSGNSFSSQPTLFSEYFLLLELWLPREQLAWPVSSLFSYLQSPLNEDTKSRVTARLGSQLFTCASQAEDGITRQLEKIRLTCSKGRWHLRNNSYRHFTLTILKSFQAC